LSRKLKRVALVKVKRRLKVSLRLQNRLKNKEKLKKLKLVRNKRRLNKN